MKVWSVAKETVRWIMRYLKSQGWYLCLRPTQSKLEMILEKFEFYSFSLVVYWVSFASIGFSLTSHF
jgi:hypothetical protein